LLTDFPPLSPSTLAFILCERSHFAHIKCLFISRQGYCRDIPSIFVLHPIAVLSVMWVEKGVENGRIFIHHTVFRPFLPHPGYCGGVAEGKGKKQSQIILPCAFRQAGGFRGQPLSI